MEDLWPARLKIRYENPGDDAYREGLPDEVLPTLAEEVNSTIVGLLLDTMFESSAEIQQELMSGLCFMFELDHVDPAIVRFRGFEMLIAEIGKHLPNDAFRVLPDDGTCQMDGYTQPDNNGVEHYWHCENEAVQSVRVSSPSGNNPDAVMLVCRKHEEASGY